MNNNDSWHRQRTYAHFDKPLSKEEAIKLVKAPNRVAKHSFWPLVVCPLKSVYRKTNSSGLRQLTTKNRPIAFASHSDSHVYSFYASMINDRLEKAYSAHPLCSNSVLAYRTFNPAKSNIHFAKEAFHDMKNIGECEVIALDVEGFFDHLDSQLLKQAWQNLFNFDKLPNDHFSVYKACTRSYGVTVPKLRDLFRGEIPRKRGKMGLSICSPVEFREKVVPELEPLQSLVSKIKGKSTFSVNKGIPQGLPISAALANLYMLDADINLSRMIESSGGVYRRYSDDILLIVPIGMGKAAEEQVVRELGKIKLNIQHTKTQRRIVEREKSSGMLKSFLMSDSYVKVGQRSAISYLGFDFDGMNTSVRGSTISRFMIKASRAIKRAKIAAEKNEEKLKRRQLYARLTTLGYGKAYGNFVYNSPEIILPKGAPHIGFFKYMRRAAIITESPRIEKQIIQVKNIVFRLIDKTDKKLTIKN